MKKKQNVLIWLFCIIGASGEVSTHSSMWEDASGESWTHSSKWEDASGESWTHSSMWEDTSGESWTHSSMWEDASGESWTHHSVIFGGIACFWQLFFFALTPFLPIKLNPASLKFDPNSFPPYSIPIINHSFIYTPFFNHHCQSQSLFLILSFNSKSKLVKKKLNLSISNN